MNSNLALTLLLIFSCLSGLSQASASGIYHAFLVEAECSGQEIYSDEASIKRFNRDFLKLLMSEQSELCSMAYSLNLTSYIRHLIYSGNKQGYSLYFNALNEQYLEIREKEKAKGLICRFDKNSHKLTPYCESDRLLNIAQLSFRVWYEFFKKDLQNSMAYDESMVIGGTSGAAFALFAVFNTNVRSQSIRFLTNSVKHFSSLLRGGTAITRSVGSSASQSALLGRGAVASRTAATGTGAGAGVTTSQLNQTESYDLLRSTDDYQIPFDYLQIEDQSTGLERFRSLVYCDEGADQPTTRSVGHRKTACKGIADFAVALVGGILPAYFVQKIFYRSLVKAPLYQLGALGIMKRATKNSIRRAVKIGKSPITLFLSGLAAAGTAGIGINYAWQANSYRKLVKDLDSNFRTRKKMVLNPRTDKNDIAVFLETNSAMHYAETLALVKAAPHVDFVERIAVDSMSEAVCIPLAYQHGRAVGREHQVRRKQEVLDKLELSSLEAFPDHSSSDEFSKSRAQLFGEGFDMLLEAQHFINSIDHSGYLGLKSPFYDLIEYFISYRTKEAFQSRVSVNVNMLFSSSETHSASMAEFRDQFQRSNQSGSNVSKQAWRGYVDALRYFSSIQQAISTSAHKFACDYGQFYEFFNEEVYLPQAPCDLGEGYEGLKHCERI